MGYKCDAIGNILGSTLGTLMKKLKMHWEHGRNIRVQKFQAYPPTLPPSLSGEYPYMYSITEIEAISHTLHQSPKLRPLLGMCHFLKRNVNSYS
jgi:hypothetical protein